MECRKRLSHGRGAKTILCGGARRKISQGFGRKARVSINLGRNPQEMLNLGVRAMGVRKNPGLNPLEKISLEDKFS